MNGLWSSTAGFGHARNVSKKNKSPQKKNKKRGAATKKLPLVLIETKGPT